MKKSLTLFALLFIFLNPVWAQPIPNGDFENWTNVGGYLVPDAWDNPNSVTSSSGLYTCEKGTTWAPHGSAYLKLTSRLVGSSTVRAYAVCSKYDIVTKKPTSGFPFTGRPAHLTGKWKYAMTGTDTGKVIVLFTRWNSTTNQRENIGGAEYDFSDMVPNWASFAIPLTYFSTAMPDTAIIGFTPSNKSITNGTFVYIDSLNFYGVASAVSNTAYSKYHMTLYPNPAKDNITVDLGMAATNDVKLWVVDLYGRVMTEAALTAGKRTYPISVKTIPAGLYFVKLQIGEETQTQRLVLE